MLRGMKRLVTTTLLIAVLVTSTAAQQKPTWQSSEHHEITLRVRDKYAVLGTYSAQFTITTPRGKKYFASVEVQGDDWGEVVYPRDFNKPGDGDDVGLFAYECTVRGKIVLRGNFVFEDSVSLHEKKKGRKKVAP